MGLQTLSIYFYWKKNCFQNLTTFFRTFIFWMFWKEIAQNLLKISIWVQEKIAVQDEDPSGVSLKNPYYHVRFYSTKFNLESGMKLLSKNRIFAVSDEKIRILTWKCCANIMYSFEIWCSIQWKCSVPFFMVEC